MVSALAGRAYKHGSANGNSQDQEHGALKQLEVDVAYSGIGLPALSQHEQCFLLSNEQGDLIRAAESVKLAFSM